ncbi:hypothetical protein Vretimale_16817, partial [Volvox reticuliferus]
MANLAGLPLGKVPAPPDLNSFVARAAGPHNTVAARGSGRCNPTHIHTVLTDRSVVPSVPSQPFGSTKPMTTAHRILAPRASIITTAIPTENISCTTSAAAAAGWPNIYGGNGPSRDSSTVIISAEHLIETNIIKRRKVERLERLLRGVMPHYTSDGLSGRSGARSPLRVCGDVDGSAFAAAVNVLPGRGRMPPTELQNSNFRQPPAYSSPHTCQQPSGYTYFQQQQQPPPPRQQQQVLRPPPPPLQPQQHRLHRPPPHQQHRLQPHLYPHLYPDAHPQHRLQQLPRQQQPAAASNGPARPPHPVIVGFAVPPVQQQQQPPVPGMNSIPTWTDGTDVTQPRAVPGKPVRASPAKSSLTEAIRNGPANRHMAAVTRARAVGWDVGLRYGDELSQGFQGPGPTTAGPASTAAVAPDSAAAPTWGCWAAADGRHRPISTIPVRAPFPYPVPVPVPIPRSGAATIRPATAAAAAPVAAKLIVPHPAEASPALAAGIATAPHLVVAPAAAAKVMTTQISATPCVTGAAADPNMHPHVMLPTTCWLPQQSPLALASSSRPSDLPPGISFPLPSASVLPPSLQLLAPPASPEVPSGTGVSRTSAFLSTAEDQDRSEFMETTAVGTVAAITSLDTSMPLTHMAATAFGNPPVVNPAWAVPADMHAAPAASVAPAAPVASVAPAAPVAAVAPAVPIGATVAPAVPVGAVGAPDVAIAPAALVTAVEPVPPAVAATANSEGSEAAEEVSTVMPSAWVAIAAEVELEVEVATVTADSLLVAVLPTMHAQVQVSERSAVLPPQPTAAPVAAGLEAEAFPAAKPIGEARSLLHPGEQVRCQQEQQSWEADKEMKSKEREVQQQEVKARWDSSLLEDELALAPPHRRNGSEHRKVEAVSLQPRPARMAASSLAMVGAAAAASGIDPAKVDAAAAVVASSAQSGNQGSAATSKEAKQSPSADAAADSATASAAHAVLVAPPARPDTARALIEDSGRKATTGGGRPAAAITPDVAAPHASATLPPPPPPPRTQPCPLPTQPRPPPPQQRVPGTAASGLSPRELRSVRVDNQGRFLSVRDLTRALFASPSWVHVARLVHMWPHMLNGVSLSAAFKVLARCCHSEMLRDAERPEGKALRSMMQHLCFQAEQHLPTMGPREVVGVLFSLASLDYYPPPHLAAQLFGVFSERQHQDEGTQGLHLLHRANALDCAHMAWAAERLGWELQPEQLQAAFRRLQDCYKDDGPSLRSLSVFVNSATKMGLQLQQEQMTWLENKLVSQASLLNCVDVSNAMGFLARLVGDQRRRHHDGNRHKQTPNAPQAGKEAAAPAAAAGSSSGRHAPGTPPPSSPGPEVQQRQQAPLYGAARPDTNGGSGDNAGCGSTSVGSNASAGSGSLRPRVETLLTILWRSAQLLTHTRAEEAATILYSLARLRFRAPNTYTLALLRRCLSLRQACSPQALAMMIWAAPRIRRRPPRAWVTAILEQAARRLPDLTPPLMAALLCGLARLSASPAGKVAFSLEPPAVAPFVRRISQLLPHFTAPRDLANVMWALARLPPDCVPTRGSAFWHALAGRGVELGFCEFGPQSLANMLWGLAKVTARRGGACSGGSSLAVELFGASGVRDVVSALERNLDIMNSAEISMTMWALGQLQIDPGAVWVGAAAQRAVGLLRRMRLRGLSTLVHSITWIKSYGPAEEVVAALEEAVLRHQASIVSKRLRRG